MIDEDEGRDLAVGGDADQERRLRREIANSNERRRMQSINAGFQSLRTLLPHHEGEKLSKAAILQQTAEYIYQLEQEKTRLLSQNSQLKRLYSLSQQGLTSPAGQSATSDDPTSPRLKKKRLTSNTSLENTSELIKNEQEDPVGSNSNTSVADLSVQLMNEQRLRMRLEERLKTLEQKQAASVPAPTVAPAPVKNTPVLPTQPLKMEVVTSEVSSGSTTATGPTNPPPTILLADKNGIRVEVEALPKPTIEAKAVIPTPLGAPHATLKGSNNAIVVTDELKSSTAAVQVSAGHAQGSGSGASRSYIVTTGANAAVASAQAGRQNLDSIVEAIRHLEGDHLFSEDSHKVIKEEVVEYSPTATIVQAQPTTNLSHHHVTVTKNLVPSKVVGLKPAAPGVPGSNPIPGNLLPTKPHPPSAVLHQQSKDSSSIIIVKSCQT